MLALYEEDLRDDLVFLSKIRNAFAHRVDITSFEEAPIRDWMDRMKVLKIHRELFRKLQETTSPSREKKTQTFVLSQELSDYRNSFHLCIRFMVHRLVEIEGKVKAHRATEMGSTSS
jgi:hypothetical protein